MAQTQTGFEARDPACEARIRGSFARQNFMAPARDDALIARGGIIRPGRQIHVAQADVSVVDHGVEKQASTAMVTLICLAGREDFSQADPEHKPDHKKEMHS